MVELNETHTLTDKFQESKQGVGEILIKHIFSDMLSNGMLPHMPSSKLMFQAQEVG